MQYIRVKSNVHLHGTWLTVPHCPLMCKYKARLSRFRDKYLLLKNSKVPKLEMPSLPWTAFGLCGKQLSAKRFQHVVYYVTFHSCVYFYSLIHRALLKLVMVRRTSISQEYFIGDELSWMFLGDLHRLQWSSSVFFTCLSQILQYSLSKLLAWETKSHKGKKRQKDFLLFQAVPHCVHPYFGIFFGLFSKKIKSSPALTRHFSTAAISFCFRPKPQLTLRFFKGEHLKSKQDINLHLQKCTCSIQLIFLALFSPK